MSNFTRVKVNLYENRNTRGFASVLVGGVFYVSGITIVEGKKGLFLGMPSRKNKEGEYIDICFPANKELRKELTDAILDEYDKLARENGGDSVPVPATTPASSPAPDRYRRG